MVARKGLAEVGSFPLRDRHHVCDSSAVMIESRAQSSLTSLYTSRRPSVKTLSFKQYYLPSSRADPSLLVAETFVFAVIVWGAYMMRQGGGILQYTCI